MDTKRLQELAGMVIMEAEEEEITLVVAGDFIKYFKEFIEEVGKKAAGGTGIEIIATTNGGEKIKCSIDGDGADRIALK